MDCGAASGALRNAACKQGAEGIEERVPREGLSAGRDGVVAIKPLAQQKYSGPEGTVGV